MQRDTLNFHYNIYKNSDVFDPHAQAVKASQGRQENCLLPRFDISGVHQVVNQFEDGGTLCEIFVGVYREK